MKPAAVLELAGFPEPAHGAQNATFIIPLADATDEREAGGKAHNLARLIALGAPAPEGTVITRTAFDRFVEFNQLQGRLATLCLDLDSGDHDQLRRRSGEIRALITSASLPPEMHVTLEAMACDLLPESMLAVRSSAVGEDGAQSSFAGQFDSILGVSTTAALKDAVRACWASRWSERALFYQAARKAPVGGMAVIVQRQVSAEVSGVLFTRAPGGTPGAAPDDLVIEYCKGLGDALVSGRIDPGCVVVSRIGLAVRTVASPMEEEDDVSGILTAQRIRELALLALKLERELGGPQDIEWAIDHRGKLWVLQARPITTLPGPTVLWSNANVNENFPQPISPLLYSIASAGYYHYFRNLGRAFGLGRKRLAMMEQPLRAIIGVHGARMYYNLTSIHAVLRMAPCGERLTRAFNQFVGADEIAPQPSGAADRDLRRSRVSQALELARMSTMTAWQYMFLRRRVESFERTADRFAAHTRAEALAGRPLAALIEDLHSFLAIRCHRWKNASLADTASMVCYAALQPSLAGTDGAPALHNRLLRALPGMPSSIPPVRLWELSRMVRADEALRQLFTTAKAADVLRTLQYDDQFTAFRRAFGQFLEDWGFRSSAELMLTLPSLQEDPVPAIELLQAYAGSEGEAPEATIARQAAERLAETGSVLRRMARRSPLRAACVWLLLRWTQRAVTYRERVRLKQALLYGRCRLLALAIGERFVRAGVLRERDEVFMLTWQEIAELGEGRAMFPYGVAELVALRSREHAKLSAMQPPDTIRLREGEYLALNGTTAPRRACESNDTGGNAEASATLSGMGACGGVVTARAAVLLDVREAGRLQRGEVLVARQTDPGWAPVFGLISGLVIERGGMLSHGAIIAREFGLPCVVGIKDATQRIAHGTRITVDGDRGTCTIVSESGAEGDESATTTFHRRTRRGTQRTQEKQMLVAGLPEQKPSREVKISMVSTREQKGGL